MSTSEAPTVRQRSSTGVVLSVVGIILLVLAAGYAAYEKYYKQLNFKLLAFHPLVDATAALGLIILIAGIVLAMRKR
jgi:hypothetical protein